jgi:hypothetical protein
VTLSIRSILFTGILAISANTLLGAQTTDPRFEGWYRAKFGRPSPTEQARIDSAKQDSVADRETTPGRVAVPTKARFKRWYRARFGRPSPAEKGRLKAAQANTAYRPANSTQAAVPANTRFEAWYGAKYGRLSPLEEANLKAHTR